MRFSFRKRQPKEFLLPQNPILVALDGFTRDQAMAHAERLAPLVGGFKVNDLLDTCGVQIVRDLKQFGRLVMADPKIYDTPKTVANRAAAYCDPQTGVGASLVTVHASAGVDALVAAVQSDGHEGDTHSILAITVLTSFDEEGCQEVYGHPTKAMVLRFARWAALAGCHGIVCSGQELGLLAKHPELKRLKRVVPGISPAWFQAELKDQKRTMTPKEALDAGADYLEIGRALFEKGDPAQNAQRILEEIGFDPTARGGGCGMGDDA
ncbi:MAG: orotidine-5'-phosphate decarboxylase [Patescibacteria group bacterium]